MQSERKSEAEARDMGIRLKERRKSLGLTLQLVADATGVNVGQLSRFEAGEFARVSPNLQKLLAHFAKLENQRSQHANQLVARFESVLARSEQHEGAARALVAALERFG